MDELTVQINTIPELTGYLTELKGKQDSDSALDYALDAQLKVLDVVQNPAMAESVFDIMLDKLKRAVEKADGPQKKLIQDKSAVMIHSMIFFREAIIQYENNKLKDEGLNLLKQGCDTLADSINAFANAAKDSAQTVANTTGIIADSMRQNVPNALQAVADHSEGISGAAKAGLGIYMSKGATLGTDGQEFLNHLPEVLQAGAKVGTAAVNLASDAASTAANAGAQLVTTGADLLIYVTPQYNAFAKKAIDFFTKKGRLKQMREDFYEFMISVLDKLEKYKELFGDSILLQELYKRYVFLIQIYSIPELQEYIVTLKNREGETAMAYMLDAQLQVLHAVQSPDISSGSFNALLDSLRMAVKKAETDTQRKLFQQKAAVMVHSMISFMEAKLYYEDDKWGKEGQAVMKEACGILANSSYTLIAMASKEGIATADVMQGLGERLFDSLIKERGGTGKRILSGLGSIVGAALQVEDAGLELQSGFYTFLDSAFAKLLKHKNIFGYSPVLHDLVLTHKDVLREMGPKSRELGGLDPENPILKEKPSYSVYNFIGISFVVLAVVLGFLYLFYLFNLWGGDKWVENLANSSAFDTAYSIHFGLLELPLIIKIVIALLGFGPCILAAKGSPKFGFNKIEIKKYEQQVKVADEYYKVLAQKLDEF